MILITTDHLIPRGAEVGLDDTAGGVSVGGEAAKYGTYFRNAYLWDVE